MRNKKITKAVKTVGIVLVSAGILGLLIRWGIFKWIVLGLGGLLGVILLTVGMILFVPIRYRVRMISDEGLQVQGKLSCMLQLFTVRTEYSESGIRWHVRVAGIRVASSEKKKREKYAEPKRKKARQRKSESGRRTDPKTTEPDTNGEERKNHKKNLRNIREKVRGYWKIVKEDRTALKKVLREAIRCIQKVLPKKCDLYLRFGLEDPAATGKVYGAYWAVYPMWMASGKGKKSVRVEADFQQKVFLAKGWAGGSFNVAGLIWPLLRIVFDPDVRKLYKDFKNGK